MYAKVFIHAVGSYYCNQDKEAINLAYDGDENSFYDDSVENADCGQLYNISASYARAIQVSSFKFLMITSKTLQILISNFADRI